MQRVNGKRKIEARGLPPVRQKKGERMGHRAFLYWRPLIWFGGKLAFSPAAAAGCIDAQNVACGNLAAAFSRQLGMLGGSGLRDPRSSVLTIFTALQSPGLKFSPLGEQGHLSIGEQLDFANEAVAAAKLPIAA